MDEVQSDQDTIDNTNDDRETTDKIESGQEPFDDLSFLVNVEIVLRTNVNLFKNILSLLVIMEIELWVNVNLSKNQHGAIGDLATLTR